MIRCELPIPSFIRHWENGMEPTPIDYMAVYAVNGTMGAEGLCTILLVFGALPRPKITTPSPTQIEIQRYIEEE